MPNQAIKAKDVHESGPDYNLAIKAGNTIYVSGQAALGEGGTTGGPGDPSGGVLVGKDDFEAQAEQAMTNLSRVLAAAGASIQDVVKYVVYMTRREDLPAWRLVRRRYFTGQPPAVMLVFVAGLAHPDFLIEIEAVAVTS